MGISDLRETLELTRFFAFRHGLHGLALELPSGVIAHLKMTLELPRREVNRAGRQEEYDDKPCAERSPAAFEHRPASQRRLVLASAALAVDSPNALEPGAWPIAALVASKGVRSARSVHRSVALGPNVVLSDELCQRQPCLKLRFIHYHGQFSALELGSQAAPSKFHIARLAANQVPANRRLRSAPPVSE